MPEALTEPPSTLSVPYFVGRNPRGYWTVRDARGLSGGFFVNRAAALHHARLEAGHAPGAVILIPHPIDLGFSPNGRARTIAMPLIRWARAQLATVADRAKQLLRRLHSSHRLVPGLRTQ
jgi:hypothetical protein